MKCAALVSNRLSDDSIRHLPEITIAKHVLCPAIVDVMQPRFDESAEENADYALVRVDAFSCNYRDKTILLEEGNKVSDAALAAAPVAYFGSDFVGTVIDVGNDVRNLSIGDRVIPDCSYPQAAIPSAAPGVTTNEASRGWLRIHCGKLLRIPAAFPEDVAAGFSIGGQTSQSMVRRSGVRPGDRALVLSARSNTSLFITNLLLHMGVHTTLATTSSWTDGELNLVAPAELVHVERGDSQWNIGLESRFDAVFDPFYDLHLPEALDCLKTGGKYVTCGFKNQHHDFAELTDNESAERFNDVMLKTMISDLSIIGNCIGTHEDLCRAVKSYMDGDSTISPVRSAYGVHECDRFLDDTYNNRQRFGKVVMRYNSEKE